MTLNQLKTDRNQLIEQNIKISARNLQIADVRLCQLASKDLRGLPVADAEISKWYLLSFFLEQERVSCF